LSAKPQYNISGVPQLILKTTLHNEPCFFIEKDYQEYLELVHQCVKNFHCHIHAYAFMPDHIYLLATSYSDNGIANMMQAVSNAYLNYVSKTYAINDTLWKAGYKACLIESESYLLECMQYIETAPVRLGLTARSAEYIWSSYRNNSHSNDNGIITHHALYMALGISEHGRQSAYQQHKILDGQTVQIISETLSEEGLLGSDVFKDSIRQQMPLVVTQNDNQCTDCVMFY